VEKIAIHGYDEHQAVTHYLDSHATRVVVSTQNPIPSVNEKLNSKYSYSPPSKREELKLFHTDKQKQWQDVLKAISDLLTATTRV